MTTEQRDTAEMKRLLTYANYSKVGKALGVSKSAVSDWSRGVDVNPKRLEQVRALMQSVAGKRKTPSPSGEPDWARALATRDQIEAMAARVQAALTTELLENRKIAERVDGVLRNFEELLGDYGMRLELFLQQRDGTPPGSTAPKARGTRKRRPPPKERQASR